MSLLTSLYMALFASGRGVGSQGGGQEPKLALDGFKTFLSGGPSSDMFVRSSPPSD